MNRLLSAVSVLVLVVPAMAAAQQDNQSQSSRPERSGRPSGGEHHGRPNGQGNNQSQNRPGNDQSQNRPGNNQAHNRPGNTQGENRPSVEPSRNRPSGHRPGGPNRPSTPGRPGTQAPFRPGSRPSSFHRFRAPPFRYPSGWGYRRWHTGSVLPHLFLSSLYFWTNWAALGLGPPPPGFVWVRFGPDLLLVDRHTGRIADVIYGAFY